jgi:hypothetical protein
LMEPDSLLSSCAEMATGSGREAAADQWLGAASVEMHLDKVWSSGGR